MAIIKPGPLVSEARGKIGGVVFARNSGGLYIRNFAAPTQGQSPLREAAKAAFGLVSNDWNDLTEGQRVLWRAYGAAVGSVNSLGETHPISGIAAFVRSNSLLQAIGEATVSEAPSQLVGGPTIFVDGDLTLNDFSSLSGNVVLSAQTGTEAVNIVAQVSGPVTPGRDSPSGLALALAGHENIADPEGPTAIDISLDAVKGVYIPDQIRFVRLRTVTASGRVGPPTFQRVTVVAAS